MKIPTFHAQEILETGRLIGLNGYTPYILLTLHGEGEIAVATPLMEVVTGHTPEGLKGKDFGAFCLMPHPRLSVSFPAVLHHLQQEDWWEGILPMRHANGSTVKMHVQIGTACRLGDRYPQMIVSLVELLPDQEANRAPEWLYDFATAAPYPLLVFRWLPEPNLLAVSPAFTQFSGYALADLVARKAGTADLMTYIAQAPAGKAEEIALTDAFGTLKWIRIHAQEVEYRSEMFRLVYCTDLAKQRRNHRIFSELEARLKDTEEIGRSGSWEMDLRTGDLYLSEGAMQLIGANWCNDEQEERPFLQKAEPQDETLVMFKLVRDAYRMKNGTHLHTRFYTRSGKVCQLVANLHPVYDVLTRTAWLYGHLVEVSQPYRLNNQLDYLRAKLEFSQQLARIGMWEWETLEDTLHWSDSFNQILDLPTQKRSGSLHELLQMAHPFERKKVLSLFEDFRSGRNLRPFSFTIITPQQQIRTIYIKGTVLESSGTVPVRLGGIVQDVTEAKELENELKYYEYLIQNVTEAIVSTNFLLEIKSWNKAAEKMYGLAAEQVIDRKIQDVLFQTPELAQQFEQIFQELFRKGHWQGQFVQPGPNGRSMVVQSSIRLLKDEEGNLLGLVLVNRNITDFVEVEKLARESQHMLQVVFDSIPEWIGWVDQDRLLMGCNRRMSQALGVPDPELLSGKPLAQLPIVAETRLRLDADFAEVLRTGEPKRNELYQALFSPQNGSVWIEATLVPLRDEEGETVGVLLSGNDVTARLQMQEQLLNKQANLTAIIENTDESVAYLDQEFRLKVFNTRFSELQGLFFRKPPEVGQAYLELLPERLRLQLEEIFNYVMLGNKLTTEREILVDNDFRWFEFSGYPVIINDCITGLCFIIRDITKRKTSEKMVIEARLNQEKIRSLAVIQGQEEERRRVSMELHDGVGQLLTALQMQFNFLKELAQPMPTLHQQLGNIDHLLQSAKHEVRRVSFNLMPSMLRDFGLAETVEHFCHQFFEKTPIDVKVDISFLEDRFEAEVEVGLFRILQEILNNALKYSDASLVTVKLSKDETNLYLSIWDDGKGFSMSELEAKKKSGNGLNNISQRVHLLNGNLTIKAAPSKGCHFSIIVPLGKN